ncbi:MAG: hypothetical protein PVG33_08370 [Chloroflexota bacterium]
MLAESLTVQRQEIDQATGAAVVLHEGSTIVVVFNALRLLRYEG